MNPYTFPILGQPNETVGYEWSPKGLKLLNKIEKRIQYHGGAKRLANDIEIEWVKGYRFIIPREPKVPMQGRYWTKDEVAYLRENIHLTAVKIGDALNRSSRSVWYKYRQLGIKKLQTI